MEVAFWVRDWYAYRCKLESLSLRQMLVSHEGPVLTSVDDAKMIPQVSCSIYCHLDVAVEGLIYIVLELLVDGVCRCREHLLLGFQDGT